MRGFKSLIIQTFLSIFAIALIIPIFPGMSFARFNCPLGYSYNPNVQLCIGKGSLRGYNAVPAIKINVFKGRKHIYICPSKYAYSKKIQLCKGEGSLKGFTAQPTVKTIAINTAKKSKNIPEKNIKNSKNIKKS